MIKKQNRKSDTVKKTKTEKENGEDTGNQRKLLL